MDYILKKCLFGTIERCVGAVAAYIQAKGEAVEILKEEQGKEKILLRSSNNQIH